MFLTSNVPALFKRGTLKLVPSDEGGLRRVAEATLVIEPFPFTLARELGEEIAGHLFTEDNIIRDELEGIDLRIRAGLQRVTVRPHEELNVVAALAPVSIKDVSVKRLEDKNTARSWLSLSFVLVFSLEDKAARNFVLDEFGKTLLWSFQSMQGELLAQAEFADSIASTVGGGIDSVTISAGGHEPVTITKDDAKRIRGTARELRKAADQTLDSKRAH